MDPLPAQMMPTVSRLTFGIFNLAIPNLIAWGTIGVVFAAAIWLRIPSLFKPAPEREENRE